MKQESPDSAEARARNSVVEDADIRVSPARDTRVLAVRHAPTLSAGLCVGSAEISCAVSVDDAAARVLPSLGAPCFTGVWTSPIERCKGLAARIAGALDLPLRIDDRLKEIFLGDWQLRSWAEIEGAEPERYSSWLKNWLTQAPPGGELASELLGRVGGWWNQLPAGQHLLISHAGVNRALRVLVGGQSWAEAMSMMVPHLQGELFEGTEMMVAHGLEQAAFDARAFGRAPLVSGANILSTGAFARH
jgi:alpha-ribazole phosphatase